MKRQWLRFSLLTAIVAMLTGAGLGWINLRWPKITMVTLHAKKGAMSSLNELPLQFKFSFGWPFSYYEIKEGPGGFYDFDTEGLSISRAECDKVYDQMPTGMFSSSEVWTYVNIIPNVLIGLVLIFTEMILLEWWLNKRRLRQK